GPTRKLPTTPTARRSRSSPSPTGARCSSCWTPSRRTERVGRLSWLDVDADVAADLKDLSATLAGIAAVLDIDRLRAPVDGLREQAARPDLWNDVEHAEQVNSKLAHKQGDLRRVLGLRQRLDDLEVLYELAEEGDDEGTRGEAEIEHQRLRN